MIQLAPNLGISAILMSISCGTCLPEVDSAVGPLRWRFATRMWAGSHDRRMPKAEKLWHQKVEEIHVETNRDDDIDIDIVAKLES